MRVSNVNGITSNMIGELLVVRGSAKAGNNGAFVITAVGAGTVDVTNAGVTVPDASRSRTACRRRRARARRSRVPVAGTERADAARAARRPASTSAIRSIVVGARPRPTTARSPSPRSPATTINLLNANAVAGTGAALWADPRLCPGVEVCDGKDDDCNGVIDDCTRRRRPAAAA